MIVGFGCLSLSWIQRRARSLVHHRFIARKLAEKYIYPGTREGEGQDGDEFSGDVRAPKGYLTWKIYVKLQRTNR